MKRLSKIKIFSGIALLGIGLIIPWLRSVLDPETYFSVIIMTESIWMTSILLGVAGIITGLIAKSVKEKKPCANARTELYAHGFSFSLGIGLFFFLMWQLIALNNYTEVESSVLTASIIATVVGILCCILTAAFYFRERKTAGFKKGLLSDLATVLLYLPAFFFMGDALYNLFA